MSNTQDFEAFFSDCMDAFREHVKGNPRPYQALWSHGEAVVLGAGSTFVEGYELSRQHLFGASTLLDYDTVELKRLLTSVSGDLAVTVSLEYLKHTDSKQPHTLTLRATQAYRREDGVWRIILRHGNAMTSQDEVLERDVLSRGAKLLTPDNVPKQVS